MLSSVIIKLYRTALVRTRMPGGVGGKARKGLPIPIIFSVFKNEKKFYFSFLNPTYSL